MEIALVMGVIIFLIGMGFYGYKRGFIRIAISLISLVVTVILSLILALPVSKALEKSPIYDNINEKVYEYVQDKNIATIDNINELGFPQAVTETLKSQTSIGELNFQSYIANQITNLIIIAITFVALCIIIYIILKIVANMLDCVSKLPLLNELNKVGGTVVGMVQGLVILWIACLLLTSASNTEFAKQVYECINANQILSLIYNNNILVILITKFLL